MNRRPLTRSDEERLRQLAVAKRRATGLLVAVTCIFVVVTVWGGEGTWAGYVQATALASMAGGLADWFAVTALFRRPLGLPIPHTAIVVERKDQFAATLGEFIRESFLTPEVLVERARAAGVVPRLGAWLAEPSNAARVAGEATRGAVAFADVLRDDDVHRTLEGIVRARVEATPLAPLAGRVLRFLTQDGRHDEVLDVALRGLDRYLDLHREELRDRLGQQSRWWMPGIVEDKIFDRLVKGVRGVLRDMANDRTHPLRRQLDERLVTLAAELETSPEARERGEQIKSELLSQPQVREWVTVVWRDAKSQLRQQASDPDSELRQRLTGAITAAGRRLLDDPVLGATVQRGLESGVVYVAEHFDGEIATLVTGTIARWDAEETSHRLELLLGPDLQYVRISGTVVGAIVGLILHVLTDAVS